MQHLILLLPLAGIVVFWLLPPSLAIPIYLFIVLISGLMYWAIVRAMKKYPKTGAEGLIGTTAKIVSSSESGREAQYLVRVKGELWNANSPDILKTGDLVTVTGIDGLILLIQRVSSSQEERSSFPK